MDKRIIINETDATTNGAILSSTDIVYIPGFSYYAETEGEGAAKKEYGKYGYPVLCKTIAEFQEAFGDRPAFFKEAQYYPTWSESTEGFKPEAIPPSGNGIGEEKNGTIWFNINDMDPSYIYACELLSRGIPVIYERMNKLGCTAENTDVTVANMYTKLYEAFTTLDEGSAVLVEDGRGRLILNSESLQVKYITTGGYPAFEYVKGTEHLARLMLTLAETRGDAIAVIDHTNYSDRKLYGQNSVFDKVCKVYFGQPESMLSYGTMFTPWAIYSATTNINDGILPSGKMNAFDGCLPGSFGYLACLANVLKTNPSWSTIAGVTRGAVPGLLELNLSPTKLLTNAIANKYQPEDKDDTITDYRSSINAITDIKGYGYCIWGNRTLKDVTTTGFALNFLNIRNLICDIKKLAYDTAIKLMFEPNSLRIWGNFKGALTPTLDKMVSTQGISGYKIIKLTSNSKTTLSAKIDIYPMYSIEKFEININITDETVTVA